MKECGYCPSARLFEAAACGVPILTDTWAGLEHFFEPGREILIAEDTDAVLRALSLPLAARTKIAERGRERALLEHTAAERADELLDLLFARPELDRKGSNHAATSSRKENLCGESFQQREPAAASSLSPFPKSYCPSEAASKENAKDR
jgi:hypothetical protein